MKRFLIYFFVMIILALGASYWMFRGVTYSGPVSDHFNGRVFHNFVPTKQVSFARVFLWLLTRQQGPWPDTMQMSKQIPPPIPRAHQTIVTFINHSTVLIQTPTLNILTDPQFSNRASPFTWLGPARAHEPGISFEQLPRIDLVLLSHNHYDHMDKATLQRLEEKFKPRYFMGLGNDVHMRSFGIPERVTTLDYWNEQKIGPVSITFVPAQHFSSRTLFDRDKTLWGGFVIQDGRHSLYFAGDTGYGPHFKAIFEKFGPMDLAMLPIGSYLPPWIMKPVHINPQEAVQAHQDLHAKTSMGIHFKTFPMANDGYEEPVLDLAEARKQNHIKDKEFIVPEFGESINA